MKPKSDRLSAVAHALADPTRRALLRSASFRPRKVRELAALQPHVTLAAISKHLQVLERAGLIVKRRAGRDVFCAARLNPLAQLERHLANYTRFWKLRVDELEHHLRARARRNQESPR